eukprot:13820649-Alexandrium_andersonii.AAC.1
MSASLVGSEMCIRDRLKAAQSAYCGAILLIVSLWRRPNVPHIGLHCCPGGADWPRRIGPTA